VPYCSFVPDVLLACDDDELVDDVAAGVVRPGTTLRTVRHGVDVVDACLEALPDLVILDLQIGNMGGMAVCMSLRLEAGAGRIGDIPVLMLLDRRPDVFLARRCGAEGWLIKPLDSIRMRNAVKALLAGETYHDRTGAPAERAPVGDAAVG
jgi:DNA-binding response OmpR family regulator